MNFENINDHLQFIERSGNTLNSEERMHLSLAVKELKVDANLQTAYLFAKITGK